MWGWEGRVSFGIMSTIGCSSRYVNQIVLVNVSRVGQHVNQVLTDMSVSSRSEMLVKCW